MNDGEHYTVLEGNDIRRYAYAAETPGESLLPTPAPNLAITDYTLSPDERSILVASGRRPIYRHSYTTSYSLIRDGRILPVLRDAEAPRDATFSPDGGASSTPTATTSTSMTSRRSRPAGSPTTAAGTR